MMTITPTPSINFVQQLAILATIAISVAVLPGIYRGDLFSFHPLLMSIGFLGFMSEGILAAHRLRHNTDGATRVAGLQNHMWIQFTSTVCITLGFYAIYRNKVT
jgi:cytochrome b-561 domain-containing protein 2